MCHMISCSVCQKATWQGCGQHIQSALQGVPEAERCPGWRTGQHQDAQSGGAGK